MAAITDPTGAADYSIDATEVTRGQYEAWVATNPPLPDSTDADCGWKSTGSYAANSTCMTSTSVCSSGCDHHPQVCVDWCDAYAYCRAVGKRLCGAISGGSNAYESFANASTSQWYRACSSGDTNTYPYGSSYSETTCNGCDYAAANNDYKTVPVGMLTGCQSSVTGYTGVYDLEGNVVEWEDSCTGTGDSAHCRLRGGSFGTCHFSGGLTCASVNFYDYSRLGTDYFGAGGDGVGFRCCSR
jgi:formylglycine-generating enzyme required for sulfatase activity